MSDFTLDDTSYWMPCLRNCLARPLAAIAVASYARLRGSSSTCANSATTASGLNGGRTSRTQSSNISSPSLCAIASVKLSLLPPLGSVKAQ